MRKQPLVNDHIYHIYNRGVEKRKVFLHQRDYLRFILCLQEFNDTAPALNLNRNINRHRIEVGLQSRKNNPFIEILAFCLMPNHYHLMARQRTDNGITEFMRKLGTGYTNYFNLKYERVGPLFQGKFKALLLRKEGHFAHLPHYIHLNPVGLLMPETKSNDAARLRTILDFLTNYRWSSLPDYLGKKNFPTVITKNFLTECIGGPKEFSKRMMEWLQIPDFEFIRDVALDSDSDFPTD